MAIYGVSTTPGRGDREGASVADICEWRLAVFVSFRIE